MKNEFVTYEIALRMKQLGFDEPCIGYYDGNNLFIIDRNSKIESKNSIYSTNELFSGVIASPTWQSAFRWFREKYGVHMTPSKYDETQWWVNWGSWTSKVCDSYEESQQVCLEKLCEIVENIKK
jgi:hypothetical protein